MEKAANRWVKQSLPRRWIEDLMRVSHRVPLVTFEREMSLAPLAGARSLHRISWPLLILKGYALVCERRPELRRAHMRYPWPHFFQAAHSIASVAIEREYRGEPAVFFASIDNPAEVSLTELQKRLTRWKQEPVESIQEFTRLIDFSKWPLFIRRPLWWYGFELRGHIRARNFGTFGLSITASSGATGLKLMSPVATTLNYGLFHDDHRLPVRLHFDHRVIDGMTAARALAELEEALNGEIAAELRSSPLPMPSPER